MNDRLDARVEGERRNDHLVARPDAQGDQRKPQRVGAVRDPDHVLDVEVCGQLALERLHLRPADEAARVDHGGDPRVELGAQLVDHGMGVEQGDPHGGHATLPCSTDAPVPDPCPPSSQPR